MRVKEPGHGEVDVRLGMAIDVSGSMEPHFKSKKVEGLIDEVLALRETSSEVLKIWSFGSRTTFLGDFIYENAHHIEGILAQAPHFPQLETRYSGAIRLPVEEFRKTPGGPALVVIVTDGDSIDLPQSIRYLCEASSSPYFFLFIGLGYFKFSLIQELKELSGRAFENVNFFRIEGELKPGQATQAIDNLMPEFLQKARKAGL